MSEQEQNQEIAQFQYHINDVSSQITERLAVLQQKMSQTQQQRNQEGISIDQLKLLRTKIVETLNHHESVENDYKKQLASQAQKHEAELKKIEMEKQKQYKLGEQAAKKELFERKDKITKEVSEKYKETMKKKKKN
jgi:hypothetical protein